MCDRCDDLAGPLEIRTPAELFRLLDRLRIGIDQEELRRVSGSCPLDAIREDAPWPDDVVDQRFRCSGCRTEFNLAVDTYHGHGSFKALRNG